MRSLLLVGLVVLFALAGACGEGPAAPAARLDPAAPCHARRASPVSYEVVFAVTVTPPYGCKVLKVWLPLPPSDATQEVHRGPISTFPMNVQPRIGVEPVYGNQFAYFEFKEPQGAQIIRHQFKVKVWELHWDLDPAKVEKVAVWPDSFKPYLESDASVRITDDLKMVLQGVVKPAQGPAENIRSVMTWVNENITYDHSAASLRGSSQHALEKRRGHCSDYHGLCAAFGRALGYPARIAYGINLFPKNSPSHCKLEVFLPPYGWVSFDVSETQRMIALIQGHDGLNEADKKALVAAAQLRLFRGFRDNTWLAQTRGTDYQLAPPASKKVAVVRTVYVEADGEALPEPDPADRQKREFSWMTSHSYTADVKVTYPYSDLNSLHPFLPPTQPGKQ